jgi:predicted RNA binding protein YcfA (HicA-like mRNA interferase family)
MPQFGPVSRFVLIRMLQRLGFQGPYSGGRHQFMRGRGRRLILPNPHSGDISGVLLAKILRQADVSREEWEGL